MFIPEKSIKVGTAHDFALVSEETQSESRKADLLSSKCDFCPRSCGADRAAGQQGVCGADERLLVARSALHFFEEPPISGRAGSGAIFFSHCPLRCLYCQNSLISQEGTGNVVSVGDLSRMCLDLQNQGALNINLVTGTHYRDQIIAAISQARACGLHLPIVWNTSGYETASTIRVLSNTVDVFLTDFKYADPDIAKCYSCAPDYPEVALAALEEMCSCLECSGGEIFDEVDGISRMRRGIIVRHLLLPGHLEDSFSVVKLIHESFGSRIRFSLMNQYTPHLAFRAQAGDAFAQEALLRYPQLADYVNQNDYERLLTYADSLGIEDYYWQEGFCAEERYIPDFDGTGITAF